VWCTGDAEQPADDGWQRPSAKITNNEEMNGKWRVVKCKKICNTVQYTYKISLQ